MVSESKMSNGFDNILVKLKTGKWTYLYFIGYGFCSFLTASIVLGGTFLTPNVAHLCSPPDDLEVTELSACSYTINSTNSSNPHTSDLPLKQQCSKWDFDNSTFSSTITSEFSLVCGDNVWRATYQTIYMIGNFFGSPLNGFVSDKLGRRLTITAGSVVFVSASVLTVWVPSFALLLLFRFLLGLMHPAVLQTGYILCMEICPPKHRSTAGIVLSLPWALGTMWWGLLGYLIRDWRMLQLAASAPGIIILIFLCFFDESPRWLIVRGKYDDAFKVLCKASRWNGVQLPPKGELYDEMKQIKEGSIDMQPLTEILMPETKTEKLKKILMKTVILFRTPVIRKRTLLMYTCFIVASTVFYGLSLSGTTFSNDPFIYVVLTGLVELPAYTLTAPIVAKLGRRKPVCFCYTLCGLTILLLGFIPKDPIWLTMTLAMVGKFCISAAYQIIYLISSEIFPTDVRLQGLGTSNLVARIGATTSPFIPELLGNAYPWAPSLLFGGASLVAGASSLLLPETLNRPLPETVFHLENEHLKKHSCLKSHDDMGSALEKTENSTTV